MPRVKAKAAPVTNGNGLSVLGSDGAETSPRLKVKKTPVKSATRTKAAAVTTARSRKSSTPTLAADVISIVAAQSLIKAGTEKPKKKATVRGKKATPSEKIAVDDVKSAPMGLAVEEEDEVEEAVVIKQTAQSKSKGRGKKVLSTLSDAKEKNAIEEEPEETVKVKPAKAAVTKTTGKGRTKRKEEVVTVEINGVDHDADVQQTIVDESKRKPAPAVAKGRSKKPVAAPTPEPIAPVTETVAPKGRGKRAVKQQLVEELAADQQPEEEEIIVPAAKAKKPSRVAKSAAKTSEEDAAPKGLDDPQPLPSNGRGARKRPQPQMEEVKEEAMEERVIASPKKKNKTVETAAKAKKNKPVPLTNDAPEEKEVSTIGKAAAPSGGRKRTATLSSWLKRASPDVDGTDDGEDTKPSKSKKTKTAAPLMNATATEYKMEDFSMTRQLAEGDDGEYNLKISSWNVAGLRSWLKKGGLTFLDFEAPDIFCLQEIKCTTEQMPEEVARLPGYHPYWLCLPGGYAGVAIYSKIMPINIEYGIGSAEFDSSGRLITAEYEKFFLINVYVPNSGRKLVNLELRMRWEKHFQEHVRKLDARKPVIVCGDMNVSHTEIDLSNPKSNTRSAGFTREEREKMTELLDLGLVDTFRHLYPDRKGAYTFWTYFANARARNVGWRLDYFLVSERIVRRVADNCIRAQCLGSDHCPITLYLNM